MDFRQKLDLWLDQRWVTNLVIGVIIFNAVLLGLETSKPAMLAAGTLIVTLDKACLAFFVVEIALKLVARGARFFKSGWNIFDVIIVGAALVPGSQTMSVLRALRILRVLRVISVAPSLRRVVEGFVTALPGMGSVFLLMAIIFYIGAVILYPPRAGAEAQIGELVKASVPRIAYVSCNPVTISRDAAALDAAGYHLDWIQVVDQFRLTANVELAASFHPSHKR